jgi:hypothetical protein
MSAMGLGLLRPPNPQFKVSIRSKSPRIGGFRGPAKCRYVTQYFASSIRIGGFRGPANVAMLRNISPAASELGDLGGLQMSLCYAIFRQQHQNIEAPQPPFWYARRAIFWGSKSQSPPISGDLEEFPPLGQYYIIFRQQHQNWGI